MDPKNATGNCGWMRCHSRCPKHSHVPVRLSHCDVLKKDITAQLSQVAVSPPLLSSQAPFQDVEHLDIFKISKSLKKKTKYGILQITHARDQINIGQRANKRSVGSRNNSLTLKIQPLQISILIPPRRVNPVL